MYDILKGVRVLDLTKVLSGPLATRSLADLGAEVIKIENPSNPDPARSFPPLNKNWSGYFEVFNRNKKSVALDLKNKADLGKFYKLVRTADVLVENMTPSVKTKLKIDFKTIKNFNKKIIYASLSGLDQKNDRKYFDVIAQAESGLMSLTGINTPTKIGPAVVDAYSGMTLAFAVVSALYWRERNGKGINISVSMLSCAVNLLEQNLIEASITKKNPEFSGNQDNAIAPFGVYKTKDGSIVLAIGSSEIWQSFVGLFPENALDRKEFSTNASRLNYQKKLTETLEGVFSNYKTKALTKILQNNNIPASEVKTMKDVLNNPWMYKHNALKKHQNFVTSGQAIRFDSKFKSKYNPAPRLAENNKEYGV